ncbi:hypothetical protein [Micromonospora sp. NPDC050200]|uniref:hypothetical protein n=1 Tax=Micromonospora sp. NPDC050200 TaxID=3155664 RepID=UPI0033F2BAC6
MTNHPITRLRPALASALPALLPLPPLRHAALDRLPDAPAGLPQRLARLPGELGRLRGPALPPPAPALSRSTALRRGIRRPPGHVPGFAGPALGAIRPALGTSGTALGAIRPALGTSDPALGAVANLLLASGPAAAGVTACIPVARARTGVGGSAALGTRRSGRPLGQRRLLRGPRRQWTGRGLRARPGGPPRRGRHWLAGGRPT